MGDDRQQTTDDRSGCVGSEGFVDALFLMTGVSGCAQRKPLNAASP
jgi:hypothetical protein